MPFDSLAMGMAVEKPFSVGTPQFLESFMESFTRSNRKWDDVHSWVRLGFSSQVFLEASFASTLVGSTHYLVTGSWSWNAALIALGIQSFVAHGPDSSWHRNCVDLNYLWNLFWKVKASVRETLPCTFCRNVSCLSGYEGKLCEAGERVWKWFNGKGTHMVGCFLFPKDDRMEQRHLYCLS